MVTLQDIDDKAIERLRKLGGDNFVVELIDTFLMHVSQKMEEALTGEREGNLEAVERAVHSIKSSAGNLGAQQLQDLSAQIEQLAEDKQSKPIPPLMRDLEAAFARIQPLLEEFKKGAGE
ncbi:Hpt domain-containing protein [Candidatus Neomarinimicrobiota bacterium]